MNTLPEQLENFFFSNQSPVNILRDYVKKHGTCFDSLKKATDFYYQYMLGCEKFCLQEKNKFLNLLANSWAHYLVSHKELTAQQQQYLQASFNNDFFTFPSHIKRALKNIADFTHLDEVYVCSSAKLKFAIEIFSLYENDTYLLKWSQEQKRISSKNACKVISMVNYHSSQGNHPNIEILANCFEKVKDIEELDFQLMNFHWLKEAPHAYKKCIDILYKKIQLEYVHQTNCWEIVLNETIDLPFCSRRDKNKSDKNLELLLSRHCANVINYFAPNINYAENFIQNYNNLINFDLSVVDKMGAIFEEFAWHSPIHAVTHVFRNHAKNFKILCFDKNNPLGAIALGSDCFEQMQINCDLLEKFILKRQLDKDLESGYSNTSKKSFKL